MRCRIAWLLVGVATLAWIAGWAASQAPDPGRRVTTHLAPADPPAKQREAPRDLAQMSPIARQMYFSVRSGADWLARANRADGRFEYGFLPCLKSKLEGDHYLRQVGAAFALARAARLIGEERHAAIARQAVLTLLLETTTTTRNGGVRTAGKPVVVRHTILPAVVVNRLAAAGLLVLAISELPNPADDLLQQSDELCAFIRWMQEDDGSFSLADLPFEPRSSRENPDGIGSYPGQALHGLMRSLQHRRDAAETPWWQKNKDLAFVPPQTAAYTEAYLAGQGKDPAFAEFVFEMNDWLCGLQYTQLDPRHPLWLGGFMSWKDGKPVPAAPGIDSACYAESLADACRTARQAGDVARHRRYREALERCLQFLTTMQYTEANTQHFAGWYLPRLLGGFHASHQDGTLRIDYNQHAVAALAQYLTHVAQ
jgi:hypothetical protein